MKIKDRFREGWIILKRSFKFAELEKGIEKMTILYAYSDKPMLKMVLSKEGEELIDSLKGMEGKSLFTGGDVNFVKRYGESQDDYDKRMVEEYDRIIKLHSTVELYEGQIVQAEVSNVMCRFFPDEYSVIGRDTFEHIMTSSDYDMIIQDGMPYTLPDTKNKLFYIMSRGVNKTIAERMVAKDFKDAVLFDPGLGVLNMFCREHEILDETKRKLIYNDD